MTTWIQITSPTSLSRWRGVQTITWEPAALVETPETTYLVSLEKDDITYYAVSVPSGTRSLDIDTRNFENDVGWRVKITVPQQEGSTVHSSHFLIWNEDPEASLVITSSLQGAPSFAGVEIIFSGEWSCYWRALPLRRYRLEVLDQDDRFLYLLPLSTISRTFTTDSEGEFIGSFTLSDIDAHTETIKARLTIGDCVFDKDFIPNYAKVESNSIEVSRGALLRMRPQTAVSINIPFATNTKATGDIIEVKKPFSLLGQVRNLTDSPEIEYYQVDIMEDIDKDGVIDADDIATKRMVIGQEVQFNKDKPEQAITFRCQISEVDVKKSYFVHIWARCVDESVISDPSTLLGATYKGDASHSNQSINYLFVVEDDETYTCDEMCEIYTEHVCVVCEFDSVCITCDNLDQECISCDVPDYECDRCDVPLDQVCITCDTYDSCEGCDVPDYECKTCDTPDYICITCDNPDQECVSCDVLDYECLVCDSSECEECDEHEICGETEVEPCETTDEPCEVGDIPCNEVCGTQDGDVPCCEEKFEDCIKCDSGENECTTICEIVGDVCGEEDIITYCVNVSSSPEAVAGEVWEAEEVTSDPEASAHTIIDGVHKFCYDFSEGGGGESVITFRNNGGTGTYDSESDTYSYWFGILGNDLVPDVFQIGNLEGWYLRVVVDPTRKGKALGRLQMIVDLEVTAIDWALNTDFKYWRGMTEDALAILCPNISHEDFDKMFSFGEYEGLYWRSSYNQLVYKGN